MTLVAGVDSSTQSCKVMIRDADSGRLVRHGRARHPAGTEVDPAAWWDALRAAVEDAGGLDDVAALAVAGQQHGMVCLDHDGNVVRPALLWNDTRSAGAAEDLVKELDTLPGGEPVASRGEGSGEPSAERSGEQAWVEAVGSVPVAAFTVSKLRWLAEREPRNAGATAAVCLPHDWLTWRLAGAGGPGAGDLDRLVTDRSDASGTGYWSAAAEGYRPDLLELALGSRPTVPTVLAPSDAAGETVSGAVLAPGAGDNAAAALGLDAQVGDVTVSVGTSGVVAAVSSVPSADATGAVAGFADATGRFLPLVCTLNAARVLDATATLLGVSHDELSRLALSADAGAGGLVLVPYLEGERTPDLPDATGSVHGLTLATSTPAHLARAAVEGMLCGLADGMDALVAQGARPRRVVLLGGGAASEAVRRIAPGILGVPVEVPEPGEYVADGACRQAAWVLRGGERPPGWASGQATVYEADPTPDVRDRYAAVRNR